MMIYVLFLISLYQAVCYGQYVTEIDDCIQNGVKVTPGSFITQDDFNISTCGFIMQANQYIVVQPILVNITLNTRIRLFLITGSNDSTTKTLVHEYYSRFLFRNLILIAEGNQTFVLVVLNKNASHPIGNFQFLFRTNCYVEMAAEDFPRFNTPNYYPRNPALISLLDRNNLRTKQCFYKIFSKSKRPFSVKFNQFNNWWFGFYINNRYVQQKTVYTFDGQSDVYINLTYDSFYSYSNTVGFNGSVEILFDLQLSKINGGNKKISGIPQLQYEGKNFSFQHGSLTRMDAQIMCINLGFGGLDNLAKFNGSIENGLLFHEFHCTGPEKRLSQCAPITKREMHFKKYYYRNARQSFISCTENFPIRLINGANSSSGLVQVKVAGNWGYMCAYNMDQYVGDVLCRELGFKKGAKETTTTGQYSGYYYDTVISNVRCESHTKLKDCYYQTSITNADYYSHYYRNNYYYNNEFGTYTLDYNYYNNYYYWNSYCWSGVVRLNCKENVPFALKPGHFEGYLMVNESLVCDTDFTKRNADVYCRAFGYPGVWRTSYEGSIYTGNYTIVNMRCQGNEDTPSSCQVDYDINCPNNKTAGVICQTVALAGGSNPAEGRVEVFFEGKKGLLCDDGFDINDGNVICQQLGFSYAETIFHRAASMFGYGNGIFLLTYLGCTGNESTINDCYYYPWGQYYCFGNDVSGLICDGITSYCGITNETETNDLSENGNVTTFGANPWQARIITSFTSEWCSATILNRNWLITSANCFLLPDAYYQITTMLSTYYWNSANLAYTNNIQSVYIHPHYSAITGDYNIALIKVSSPMAFSSNVQSICLPSSNVSLNGTQCQTTGWNHRLKTSYKPLMGKIVNVQSSNYCMTETRFDSSRMERYLCSNNNMEPSAVFNGENGGPLVCSIDGRNTLVGVVGRSINGARATSIRLYSRVDFYLKWIHETMKN